MNRSIPLTDWTLIFTAALFVGSTFLFINIAVKEVPPLTTAALRTLIMVPLCGAVMRASGMRLPRTRQGWIALFWIGLLTGVVPSGTLAWGLQHIESGMGGILFGTMPILAVVLAPLFLAEERFTRWRLVGGVAGLAGIILLMGPSVLANAGDQILGIAVTALAPVSHTLGAIYARRQTDLPPFSMITGSMMFASAILLPLAFAAEAPLSLRPSLAAIAALVATGVFTAIGFIFYFTVIRRIGPVGSSLVPMFFPVVAVVLGAVVLAERLPLEAFIGLALIMGGSLAVSSRTPAKPAVAAAPVAQGQR